MMTYRQAHEGVSATLNELAGMTTALNRLAMEHSELTGGEDAEAINSLIARVHRISHELPAKHEAEWKAARAESTAEPRTAQKSALAQTADAGMGGDVEDAAAPARSGQGEEPAMDLLDATDELMRARGLLALIQMTCAENPDAEQKAIAEGCDSALARIDAVRAAIEAHSAQSVPPSPAKGTAQPDQGAEFSNTVKREAGNDLHADFLELESDVGHIANLVLALQTVLWDFTQDSIADRRVSEKRSAIIGMGDALEKAVRKALPDGL